MARIYKNGTIYINRGDSFSFDVELNIGNNIHPQLETIGEKDAVYVGIMEPNQFFENAILKKKLTKNNMVGASSVRVDISPNDTVNLFPGKYYYQVKLQKHLDDNRYAVYTIVDSTQFYIFD